jgi:hypothetical protein
MATFLQGVHDEYGPMQLYKPDYAFLMQVYGTRQAEYDRGFNAVKSLYNSALNNSLTSESNELYRQEVFKKIQNSLKSVSGVDLSNPTNIMKAQTLVDPITKDNELAYDMAITQFHQKQKQRMEAAKNSTDAKVRATYNDDSRLAIQFAEQDLKSAKRGDGSIQKIQPQEFVPQEDIAEYLNKAAKDQGIKISLDQRDGKGYIVTTENGPMSQVAFTNWAKAQMGNRFDRQLNQKGFVQAESTIRSVQQSQGLSRDQAINSVADELSKQLMESTTKNAAETDNTLKKLNDEIGTFKKNYPNGIPVSLVGDYKKLLEDRDAHMKELQEHTSLNANIKNQGTQYVAQNLHNIFTSQVKGSVAGSWAKTYSDATTKVSLSADQPLIDKWKIASQEKMHAATIASNEKLKQMELQQKERHHLQDYTLELAKAKGKGEIASEDLVGKYTSNTETAGVDIMNAGRSENNNNLFLKSFGAGNGLMNLIVGSENHNKYFSVLQKVQQIAQGNSNVKLSQEEKDILGEYGTTVGVQVADPNYGAAVAQAVIDNLVGGTYVKAGEKVHMHVKQGKTKNVSGMINVFNDVLGEMTTLMSQRDNLNQNYKNVAKTVLDPAGNIKPEFQGATIVGRMEDGTPIVDVSGLSIEKRKYLDNVVGAEYTSRTHASGDIYQFNNLSAGELFAITNGNIASNIRTSEGAKISQQQLAQLSSTDVSDLFGKNAIFAYDPQSKMVHVKLNVSPSSSAAKALKIASAQNIEMDIPYQTIMANQASLGRVASYVQKNSVNNSSIGSLSSLVANPNARVTAPSFMSAAGFKYDVAGVNDSDGHFGLGINFTYTNPDTKQQEHIYKFQPIENPQDPNSFLKAERYISTMYETYITEKESHDGKFEKEELVKVD